MIAFLTELAKVVTPLLLITLAVQQYWAKRAADKRGVKVEAAANKAQTAATHAAEQVVEVATKTEDVRKTLVETDSNVNHKLDTIHTLVNSNMGTQLKISAGLARQLADLTKTESALKIAEEYERLVADHDAKQAQVDSRQSGGI
jgi:hypothetical protein